MVKLELKTIEMLTDGGTDKQGNAISKKCTYVDLIEAILNNPPKDAGFTYSELRARQRISDVVKDKAGETVDFEDNDMDKLRGLLKNYQWPNRHPEIIQFCADVMGD